MTFASLSPTLLARKGGAKPAMRRQSVAVAGAQAHQPGAAEAALEDLGWNDLGEPEVAAKPAPATPEHANDIEEAGDTSTSGDIEETEITPEPEPKPESEPEPEPEHDFAPLAHHATSTATTREAAPKNVTPFRTPAPRLPRPKLVADRSAQACEEPVIAPVNATSTGKRTAFTLRLDADRHLKLRLACTLAGRSAQALVTEAVDAMFAETPELDTLFARVQSRASQEG